MAGGFVLAATARPAAATDPRLQDAVLREVNAFRASQRRPPLQLDLRLSQAATAHSNDMLRSGRMSHTGSDGSDPGARITRTGYHWRSYRENVGAGYVDARQAVAGWIASADHRANLLADDVTQVGVGFAGGPGMMPGNVPRLFWTLVLATPR
ncbi:CAP domain-containing protein [Roseomonas sp. CAU 1739]|uniref:CAP domain-containing protein n=1 Tax=Roseomonas sp. CAU 1739 TaxID=3140364 RepID=UPI00325BE87E